MFCKFCGARMYLLYIQRRPKNTGKLRKVSANRREPKNLRKRKRK